MPPRVAVIQVHTGPAGRDGTDGADGTPGGPGATGATGAAGTNGTNGTNGADGAPGLDASLITAFTIVVNASSAYTVALADAGKTVEMSNSSASVVTIPPTTAAAIPVGSYYNIVRTGVGAVSITTGSSVTLLSASSARILPLQYSMATLYKSTGDTWVAGGNLTTV